MNSFSERCVISPRASSSFCNGVLAVASGLSRLLGCCTAPKARCAHGWRARFGRCAPSLSRKEKQRE